MSLLATTVCQLVYPTFKLFPLKTITCVSVTDPEKRKVLDSSTYRM